MHEVRRKMASAYGYYLDDTPIGDVVIELSRLRDLYASEQALRASAGRTTPYWTTDTGNRLHRDNCVVLEPLQSRLLPWYWIARATEELRRHYWPAFGQATRLAYEQVIRELRWCEDDLGRSDRKGNRDSRVPASSLALIAALQGEYRCHYCKRLGPNASVDSDGSPWHADHFVALSRGGIDSPRNIVRACKKCNLKKSSRDAYEFCQAAGYEPPDRPPLSNLA